ASGAPSLPGGARTLQGELLALEGQAGEPDGDPGRADRQQHPVAPPQSPGGAGDAHAERQGRGYRVAVVPMGWKVAILDSKTPRDKDAVRLARIVTEHDVVRSLPELRGVLPELDEAPDPCRQQRPRQREQPLWDVARVRRRRFEVGLRAQWQHAESVVLQK